MVGEVPLQGIEHIRACGASIRSVQRDRCQEGIECWPPLPITTDEDPRIHPVGLVLPPTRVDDNDRRSLEVGRNGEVANHRPICGPMQRRQRIVVAPEIEVRQHVFRAGEILADEHEPIVASELGRRVEPHMHQTARRRPEWRHRQATRRACQQRRCPSGTQRNRDERGRRDGEPADDADE